MVAAVNRKQDTRWADDERAPDKIEQEMVLTKEKPWWARPVFLSLWCVLSAVVVFSAAGLGTGVIFRNDDSGDRREEGDYSKIKSNFPKPGGAAGESGGEDHSNVSSRSTNPTTARTSIESSSKSSTTSLTSALTSTSQSSSSSSWEPYFKGEEGEALRYRMTIGDWRGAEEILKKALQSSSVEERVVRFLSAYVMWKSGKCEEALTEIEWIKTRWKLMSSRLDVKEALCAVKTGDHERAERAAKRVSKGQAAWVTARLILGAVYRKGNRWKEARKLYTDFLNSSPKGGIPEARYRLVESLQKTGGKLSKILTQLQLIERDYPTSQWAKLGAKKKKKVLAGAPAATRNKWKRLPCAFAVERADRLMKASRYTQARKELKRLVENKGSCSPTDHCKAAYYYAQCFFKVRKRKQSAPMFERAVDICDKGGPADIRAKAKYQAGRSNRFRRRFVRARNYFRRLEREHPNHSYADDARLRLAETWDLDNKPELAYKTYETLVKKYPKGDMRQEAHWRLVRTQYLKGNMKESLQLLEWGISNLDPEEGPHEEGRSLYWTGRVLQKVGRTDKAVEKYEAVKKAHPLSYYSWLASGRLAELDSKRLTKLKKEWDNKKVPGVDALLSNLKKDPIFFKPGFLRAVELAKMGLGKDALAELRSVGIEVFRGRPSAGRKIKLKEGDARRLWAATILLDSAGLYHLSHWTPRHVLKSFMSKAPVGENRIRWRLAYPSAYGPLVRKSARLFAIPDALLYGIMREESAFNPGLVSRAKAVGLTQLLVPTAKRFARGMDVDVNYKTLKKARINVPIGARYLGYLLASFGGAKALAVASYNAGEHRLVRWVKKHKALEVDEFVELIPFDQTRKYTKRVLGSAFVYSYLGDPSQPFLPVIFKLPTPRLGSMPPLKKSND